MNKKLFLLIPISLLTLGCQGNPSGGNKPIIHDQYFSVTWTDYNGTVLEVDTNVPRGATPSYDGEIPARVSTDQYTYTFASWSPVITPVERDITYMATYSATTNEYTVTWKNYDGEILLTQEHVPYGTEPYYGLDTPYKPSTVDKSYYFNSWQPAVERITGDTVFTATYDEYTRYYLITWKNWDNKTLKISSVAYGSTPVYDGINPTHVADETNTYTFSGWSPEIVTCTGDATYIAQYTAVPIE